MVPQTWESCSTWHSVRRRKSGTQGEKVGLTTPSSFAAPALAWGTWPGPVEPTFLALWISQPRQSSTSGKEPVSGRCWEVPGASTRANLCEVCSQGGLSATNPHIQSDGSKKSQEVHRTENVKCGLTRKSGLWEARRISVGRTKRKGLCGCGPGRGPWPRSQQAARSWGHRLHSFIHSFIHWMWRLPLCPALSARSKG